MKLCYESVSTRAWVRMTMEVEADIDCSLAKVLVTKNEKKKKEI